MPKLDYFIIKKPFNNDIFCGDTGLIKEFDNRVFIGIVDVLGHGKEAHGVAITCEDFLEKHHRWDLVKLTKELHQHIKGSRGAVVGLCLLDMETGRVECVGAGNIGIKKFGSHIARIILGDGIVGYMMPTPKVMKMNLDDGDVLVLYTDGITDHFDLEDYPGLLEDDAKTIASGIINRFGKKHDDALCIVLLKDSFCWFIL